MILLISAFKTYKDETCVNLQATTRAYLCMSAHLQRLDVSRNKWATFKWTHPWWMLQTCVGDHDTCSLAIGPFTFIYNLIISLLIYIYIHLQIYIPQLFTFYMSGVCIRSRGVSSSPYHLDHNCVWHSQHCLCLEFPNMGKLEME